MATRRTMEQLRDADYNTSGRVTVERSDASHDPRHPATHSLLSPSTHTPIIVLPSDISKYNYEPIDPTSTEIRLLTLQPSADKAARLCGTLQKISLQPTLPKYEALSYVWNDYRWAIPQCPDTFPLKINEGEVTISRSLALALFRIRDSCHARVLWIDAVCIDQENSDEKSHQVQQMYTIYSQADRVLIWLGDDGLDNSSTSIGRLLTSDHRYLKVAAVFFRSWWDRVW